MGQCRGWTPGERQAAVVVQRSSEGLKQAAGTEWRGSGLSRSQN